MNNIELYAFSQLFKIHKIIIMTRIDLFHTGNNGGSISPSSIGESQPPGPTVSGSIRSCQERRSPTPVRMPPSPDVGVPTTPKSTNASTPVSSALSQSPQVMVSPTASLHHMQQLLQQHVLTPAQLQTLMKQHSMYFQQSQHQHQVRELNFHFISLFVQQ